MPHMCMRGATPRRGSPEASSRRRRAPDSCRELRIHRSPPLLAPGALAVPVRRQAADPYRAVAVRVDALRWQVWSHGVSCNQA
eukprot:350572-Chlamydomonas_euryale.AAC.7